MVHLLLGVNFLDGRRGQRIQRRKLRNLLLEMSKNNTFYRDGRRGYGMTAENASGYSEDEAADSTQVVAPAARDTAALKLRTKDAPVAPFVIPKLHQGWNQVFGRYARRNDLAGIDTNGALFAGVVYLNDARAEIGDFFRSSYHVS